jgi:hypothetical protein
LPWVSGKFPSTKNRDCIAFQRGHKCPAIFPLFMPEFPKIADAPIFAPPPSTEWMLTQPSTYPLWFWGVILAIVLLAAWALTRVLRKPEIQHPPAPPLANHVMAMTLLEEIRPLATELPPKELAARVTEIMRTYLHRQFGILARYRTSQEILAQRGDPNRPPALPAVRAFEDFLLTTDALNYGGVTSAPQSFIDEAIDTIRRSQSALTPLS